MRPQNLDHMFAGLSYTKTSAEIKTAAQGKIEKLKAKIEERTKRIADLRKEYSIDDTALIQLLTAARKQEQQRIDAYSYSSNVAAAGAPAKIEERTVGAGVVNNLLTENDYIEAEKDAVSVLELIVRNIRPIRTYTENGDFHNEDSFQLSRQELKYLGF